MFAAKEKIKELTSEGLINLLKHNGFEDCLNLEVSGKDFLDAKENDLIQWFPINNHWKKYVLLVKELQSNPQFLAHPTNHSRISKPSLHPKPLKLKHVNVAENIKAVEQKLHESEKSIGPRKSIENLTQHTTDKTQRNKISAHLEIALAKKPDVQIPVDNKPLLAKMLKNTYPLPLDKNIDMLEDKDVPDIPPPVNRAKKPPLIPKPINAKDEESSSDDSDFEQVEYVEESLTEPQETKCDIKSNRKSTMAYERPPRVSSKGLHEIVKTSSELKQEKVENTEDDDYLVCINTTPRLKRPLPTVPECFDVTQHPYYKLNYTTEDSRKALADKECGRYLFRASKRHYATLVVKGTKKIYQIPLTRLPDKAFTIDQSITTHRSITDLIKYYTTQPIVVNGEEIILL